jgi:threonine aldolase
MPNEKIDALKQNVSFEIWGARGEKQSLVRFVTDWSTTKEDVDKLISYLDLL